MHPRIHGPSVALRVGLVGLGVVHRVRARRARRPLAQAAVRLAVGNAVRLVRDVKVVAAEHHADRVVVVVVARAGRVREQLDLKSAVLGDVAVLDEHAARVLHVARRRPRHLLVGVVVLDDLALHVQLAAVRARLLRVRAKPDLELVDLGRGEARGLQRRLQVNAVVVAACLVAQEHVGLAAEQHLHPHNEVVGQRAAEVVLELREDADEVVGLDVLGGVDAEAAEADAQQVRHVVRDALLHAVALRVQIGQPRQPAGVEVQR
mmetsp:Transcript_25089/g.87501  ORF Transcript_25089/g.87501 Transcript_25089/m.87501 type:complete len:263 (+) Transcript_25089:174-962(+)